MHVGETATEKGGTYLTGMNFCFMIFEQKDHRISVGQRTKTGQYFHYNITETALGASHPSPFLEKARSILFICSLGGNN